MRAARRPGWGGIGFLAAVLEFVLHCSAQAETPGIWTTAASMTSSRSGHTATLLADGRVLITGGVDQTGAATSSAEFYDPAAGTFSATGAMGAARAGHAAVRMADGRVLVAGGGQSSAEIYDPPSGSFAPTGPMLIPRSAFTATLLPSGQVLVSGGSQASGSVILASAELFDPDAGGGAGAFIPAGAMTTPRAQHTASLLSGGTVLIAGGSLGPGLTLNTGNLYDPVARAFSALSATMVLPRALHQATVLASGKVLLSGAAAGPAELYDPATAAFTATGTPMVPSRAGAASVLLPTGKVLLAGGTPGSGSAEIYDPATGLFASTGSLQAPRAAGSASALPAVLLGDGRLLVAGGTDLPTGRPTATAELYTSDPVRAYVPSADGSIVSVIDTATNTVAAAAPVGSGAVGAAVHPAGTRAYITNTASRTLSVIDAATNAVVATIPLGEGGVEPLGVAVMPDGSRVYVANVRSGTVSVVDTATNAIVATLSVGSSPLGVAVDPSGAAVYLTSGKGTDVAVVETATNTRAASVAVGETSYGVAVSPDGERLYVALESGELAVVDTSTHAVAATVPVGAKPRGVAATPDGARVYVANSGDNTVSVVDTASNTVVATVPVGAAPDGVAVTPDGRRAYVVNSGSADVSVLDLATDTVSATVAVAAHPSALGLFVGAVVPPAPDPPGSADLSVTNAANPSSASTGDTLTYTITVSNAGPSTAKSVTVRDTLSSGAAFLSVRATQGSCVGGTGAVSCNLGSLAKGASAAVNLAVTITGAGQLGNTAGVGSTTPDPDAGNNVAAATVTVAAGGATGGGGSIVSSSSASSGPGPTPRAASSLAGPVPKAGSPPDPPSKITGVVTDASTGLPLSGVTIDVFHADGIANSVPGFSATTDGSGVYTTPGALPDGIYKVRARLPNHATTWAGSGRSFVEGDIITVTSVTGGIADIAMPPGAGLNDGINGTVTDASNNPLGGVAIDLFDANNNSIDGVQTAAGTGFYSLQRRMVPGVYKVRARAPNFATTFNSDKHTFPTADLVVVQAGSDTTVDFKLAAGADIQGTIKDASLASVVGAVVDVYEAGTLNFIESGSSGAGGAYNISRRLPAGSYIVRARQGGSASFVALTFYNGKSAFSLADTITLTAGQIQTGIDFTLGAVGAISGTVTDGVNPIPGAQVDFFDAATNTGLGFNVRADANGVFSTATINGVSTGFRVSAAGSYKIRVRLPGRIDTFYHTGSDVGLDLFTATAISAPGTANVALPAGGTITGTVRERGTNNPLPGVPVNTFRVAASTLSGAFTVLTDANGNYTLGGLHDGEWVVRADAPGHINAFYSGNADNPASDSPTATPVVISGAGSVSNVNINLATGGGVIRGRITRKDNGQPFPPGSTVQIRLYPRMAFIVNVQVSSFDLCPGAPTPCNFTVGHLAPGDYALEAFGSALESDTAIGWSQHPVSGALGTASRSTPLPVSVTGGGTTTADFEVPAFAGGGARTLSGFVKDTNGNPIKSAEIGVFELGGQTGHRFVNVGGDGSFFLNHLPPGKYLLRADTESTYVTSAYGLDTTNGLPGQPYAEPLLAGAAVIDVTAGGVSGIEIRMPDSAGTVTGTISRVCPVGDPTGCTPGTLAGIMGAGVSIQNFFSNGVGGATTRADGSYLVRGLPPGSYKVRVSAPGPGFITRFYRCDNPPCAMSTGTALIFDDGSFITVAAGQQVSNISMILDPGGGSITGTVRGPGNVPVVAALVQAREATGGATVTAVTAVDGTYTIPQLTTGNYKLRVFSLAPGLVTQWYSGKATLGAGDAVSVTAPGNTGNVDFVVSTNEGTFSGQVFHGATPVAGAGVVAYDTSGDFIRGTGVAGKDGKYMMLGLAPGSYIAQVRGLGYARNYLGGVPDLGGAQAFAINVQAGAEQPGNNFNLTLTSDITGTISYAGQQTGALKIGLFADSALTQRLYSLTIPSPVFPQAYGFSKPPPDIQGILPGTYYVGAFIDSNPNSAQDAIEASGKFGGATPSAVVVAEGETVSDKNLTLADGVSAAGTTSSARSVPQVTVPPDGNPSATLGDIEIDENGTGALSVAGRIQVTLPAGLTFVGMPTVSTLLSNGLKIWQSGPNNPANCTGASVPALDLGGQRFSFAVCQKSTTGAARILVSSVTVAVPAGFVPDGAPCPPIDPPSNRVCAGISASVSNGLTPAAVQNASFVPPPPVPTLTGVSVSAVGQGVTRNVVLTGENFTLLDFANGDTIDFGPGITVTNITVNSDTQMTVTIQIGPGAQLGPHDIIITNNPGGEQLILDDVLQVDAPPTIASAGTGAGGTGPLFGNVKMQTVTITGTNFQAPTTLPSNLVVLFGGTGITVNGVSYTSATQISVEVDVALGAEADGLRTVTVINPDLGMATSSPILAVTAPPLDAPVGLPASKTSGTSTPPPTPSLSGISPLAARTGTFVTITGSGFSTTGSADVVTFAGPSDTRVTATLNPAILPTATSLSAKVPDSAVDGAVMVAVNGVQSSNSVNFTVTNPRLSSVTPGSAVQGDVDVMVDLTGAKFAAGAAVSFNPPSDLTVGAATISPDGTDLKVPVTVAALAALGLRDVTVTNSDGGSATLSQAFEVKLKTAVQIAVSLKTLSSTPVDVPNFLPSADDVRVTLDATGKCTGKTITPSQYLVDATFTVPPATLPSSLTFTLTSSALPGTATNENCEPNPLVPAKDYSIGLVGAPPDVTSQRVVVPNASGVYRAQLAVWDWGGNVRIDVTDNPSAPTMTAGLTLPVDTDHDTLPDAYETDAALNANSLGVNVLDKTKADLNANGVLDGFDKFSPDGLTNFEKYRGVYLKAPVNGSVNAQMLNHVRLGAGMRNLFVRGRGFSTDPAVQAVPNACGIDGTGNPVVQDPSFLAAFPCPAFQVGAAFASIGVKIGDVTTSFGSGTVFPTKSLADPTKPMLDLATVTYDAVNCSGGAACDHSSKTGVRQWQFPTLGFSTFGTSGTYGDARVFARAMKGYFTDKPYLHQENLAGTYLPTSTTGGVPMLAPITIVCDKSSKGGDDGLVTSGECTAGGALGGDVYVSGTFNKSVSAMDVNNDRCVELPFVSDPTTLAKCDPKSNSAVSPQATLQQVTRSIITHELAHATGVNLHTTDSTDVVYQYSINWTRDGHFSGTAAALVQVHNKGQQ